ncbi:MAG: helix-turn-helix transcriptional regulator [Wolinella sp.]
MNRALNLSDFFERVSCEIEPNSSPKYGQFAFANSELKFDFSAFNGGHGLGYYQSKILCRNSLLHHADRGIDYSFLFFNTGTTPIAFRNLHKRIVLGGGEFWIGVMQEEHRGIHEFQSNFYQAQCISLKTSLAQELGILDGLDMSHDLALKSFKIRPIQRLILSELSRLSEIEGKMREIFIESKIMEIIYKSFAKSDKGQDSELLYEDVAILHKARDILLSNLENPPSIKSLARACATNEFKLKSNFKRYFGTTIYGLLQNERLDVARTLLERNDISVQEASKLVGYRSAPHFAKIFKERFKILPSELSKSYYEITNNPLKTP